MPTKLINGRKVEVCAYCGNDSFIVTERGLACKRCLKSARETSFAKSLK